MAPSHQRAPLSNDVLLCYSDPAGGSTLKYTHQSHDCSPTATQMVGMEESSMVEQHTLSHSLSLSHTLTQSHTHTSANVVAPLLSSPSLFPLDRQSVV